MRANTNDHQLEHSLLFYNAEFDKRWWNQVTCDPYPYEVVELHRLRHPEDHETRLCKGGLHLLAHRGVAPAGLILEAILIWSNKFQHPRLKPSRSSMASTYATKF
ncbi:unnamed protein product [Linum tenue]|uniref:Uncharacterized protein n=1 Tax=Linum tenue TaxID=586396 RepID=A0AAV0I7I3_9ROSI|nr:unnamed protein product [Linum tenue]